MLELLTYFTRQAIVTICYGGYGVGFVVVDIDTLQAQGAVDGGTGIGGLAIIFRQGEAQLSVTSLKSTKPEGSNPLVSRRRPLHGLRRPDIKRRRKSRARRSTSPP